MSSDKDLKSVYEQFKKLSLSKGNKIPEFDEWLKEYRKFFDGRGGNL